MPITVIIYSVAKLIIGLLLVYKIRLSMTPQGTALGIIPKGTHPLPIKSRDQVPDHTRICAQIPIYNEEANASDVIRSVADLEWPREFFEIQVLDDSNDRTSLLISNTIESLKITHPTTRIVHVQRHHRRGYKAGALSEGFSQSGAEYFAIFDCDFRPEKDFLTRLMPSFSDPKVAAVQARWTFRNSEKNILTKLQRLTLNYHFSIEQEGRFHRKLFFNFNGTAGVWKGAAISDSGGWQSDTVTEDLMLSYRAQLRGWRLVYRDDVTCLSELPESMPNLLVQQRRWALGNGQVLRLMFRDFTRSCGLVNRTTQDALLHLFGYGLSSLITGMFLLTPFYLVTVGEWYETIPKSHPFHHVEVIGWLILLLLFYRLFCDQKLFKDLKSNRLASFLDVTALLFLSPMLAWLVTGSFWKGLLSRPGNPQNLKFHRTPKTNSRSIHLKPMASIPISFWLFKSVCLTSLALSLYYAMPLGVVTATTNFGFLIYLERVRRIPVRSIREFESPQGKSFVRIRNQYTFVRE